jgi:hypothetical protein
MYAVKFLKPIKAVSIVTVTALGPLKANIKQTKKFIQYSYSRPSLWPSGTRCKSEAAWLIDL